MPTARRRVGALSAAVLLAISLAACSKVGGGTTGEVPEDLQADLLTEGYEGSFDPPPSDGPEAQQGKEVWYISCGQAYVACASAAEDFSDAGDALGWDVTVVDGKADPSTAANLIRQGVAAGVDGMALFTYDCPGIKSALLEAQNADVPVVNFGSLDCDDEGFGGGDKLFAASLNIQGSDDQGDFWSAWGAARGRYAVAALGDDGGSIIDVNETSQRGHQYIQQGFVDAVDELCPDDCEVVDTPFTFSQVPTKSSEIFKAALTRNPDAEVFSFEPDAMMGLGVETVLKQSGRSDLVVAGGEGLPSNIELIREGKQTQATYIPYPWYMWGLADTLNRIFAGETDLPSQGGGYLYVDADHNLPDGDAVEVPVDFKAAYEGIWSGEGSDAE